MAPFHVKRIMRKQVSKKEQEIQGLSLAYAARKRRDRSHRRGAINWIGAQLVRIGNGLQKRASPAFGATPQSFHFMGDAGRGVNH